MSRKTQRSGGILGLISSWLSGSSASPKEESDDAEEPNESGRHASTSEDMDTRNAKKARTESDRAIETTPPEAETSRLSLAGKTIVFTGTLIVVRAEAANKAKAAGATVASSISGKTDLVVAGVDAGSKLDVAKAKGIPVISEVEFHSALKCTPVPTPTRKTAPASNRKGKKQSAHDVLVPLSEIPAKDHPPVLTKQLLNETETPLGVKLPASFVQFCKEQNGGDTQGCWLRWGEHGQVLWVDTIHPIAPESDNGRFPDTTIVDRHRLCQNDDLWTEGIIAFATDNSAYFVAFDYREATSGREPKVAIIDGENTEEPHPGYANFTDFLNDLKPGPAPDE